MLIEILTVGGSSILGMVFLYQQGDIRQPRLKNSEAVKIDVLAGRTTESLTVYIPTTQFIKNMSAAVERERGSVQDMWKAERSLFHTIWATFAAQKRREFLERLNKELVRSIQMYCDSDKLLHVICPELSDKYMMSKLEHVDDTSRAGSTADATGDTVDDSVEPLISDRLSEFLSSVVQMKTSGNKISSKKTSGNKSSSTNKASANRNESNVNLGTSPYQQDTLLTTAIMVLNAHHLEGDLDPSREPSDFGNDANQEQEEDITNRDMVNNDTGGGTASSIATNKQQIELTLQVELFLVTLQQLCFVMFAKQFLLRYKQEGRRAPALERFLAQMQLPIVAGIVVMIATFLLDYTGILETVLISYKSPFR